MKWIGLDTTKGEICGRRHQPSINTSERISTMGGAADRENIPAMELSADSAAGGRWWPNALSIEPAAEEDSTARRGRLRSPPSHLVVEEK
jgi:hypothetical protein